MRTFGSLIAGRPKTTRTPLRILDDTNLLNKGRLTLLEYKLCDAVTLLYLKVLFSMIEENDFDLTRIVWVDNPRSDLDTVLDCKSRTRCDPPIDTLGEYHRNSR